MGGNPEIKILMRTTEGAFKNKKEKPEYINNLNCIKNAYAYKGDAELILFGDRLSEESKKTLEPYCDKFLEITQHGNSESFREILDYAMTFDPETIIYFLEDDYLHREKFDKYLIEGLNRVDYVTLYDHPDKYNGQLRMLIHTDSTHWQITPSTTMTFASTVRVLSEDLPIFDKMITTGTPPDHYLFLELNNKNNRELASPVPSISTHGEKKWLALLFDWEKICRLTPS